MRSVDSADESGFEDEEGFSLEEVGGAKKEETLQIDGDKTDESLLVCAGGVVVGFEVGVCS